MFLPSSLSDPPPVGRLEGHAANGLFPVRNNVTTNVIRWDEVNRYGYQPLGLFIPYALGTSLSLLAVLLGLWSYWQDGVLPDKKFQDIVSAAEDPRVIHIIQDRRRSVTVEFVGNRALFRPGADV